MASSLGIYIEPNLIQYAKVSKEQDTLKVEAFGFKFYDDLGKTIKQIVEETFSYKTPISINLSNEMYTYFDMFSLLGKKYLQKAIKSEFESYCIEKEFNVNVFETRYAIVNDLEDKEKIKVINISANKLELNKKKQEFEGYRLSNISPLSMTITNLIDFNAKENAVIVNMEEKTTFTTVIDQKIYDINIIEEGSEEVLSRINRKENSYSKAYEGCKNTTIYTANAQELAVEQNYLEDIMPTLSRIVEETKQIVNNISENINKVYITGTLSCINNVDLYFQEYLPETDCEILKPYFISNLASEINTKDYIEVNSAISLALQGLNEGVAGMNFTKPNFFDNLPDWMKFEFKRKNSIEKSKGLTFDFNQKLTTLENNLISVAIAIFATIVIYAVFSTLLGNQIHKKTTEVNELIADTQAQINLAKEDKNTIDGRTNEYKSMIQTLENLNDRISDINQSRNMIPNLLNQIMFVIPENVQIIAIENTGSRHVVIAAQSNKYEQLGYFKAKLKTDGILTNVISNSGVNEGNVVIVTIEGEVP